MLISVVCDRCGIVSRRIETYVFGTTCTTFNVSDGSFKHTQASVCTNECILKYVYLFPARRIVLGSSIIREGQ